MGGSKYRRLERCELRERLSTTATLGVPCNGRFNSCLTENAMASNFEKLMRCIAEQPRYWQEEFRGKAGATYDSRRTTGGRRISNYRPDEGHYGRYRRYLVSRANRNKCGEGLQEKSSPAVPIAISGDIFVDDEGRVHVELYPGWSSISD